MLNSDQIKRGVVIEGKGAQVRVEFEENDAVASPWLDVVAQVTKGAKIYWRPKVGSLVICAMDEKWESGTVLGAIYSDEDPAPANSDQILHIEFADGTVITYDEGGSRLNFINAAGLDVTAEGNKLSVIGDIIVSGDVVADGVSLVHHTHPESIGSHTGEPN